MAQLRWRWFAVALGSFGAVACGTRNTTNAGEDGGADGASSEASSPGTDGSPPPLDGASGADAGASVLQYHMNASRDGHYVDPLMTESAAAGLKIDTTFAGDLTVPVGGTAGTVWSQPLYVENGVMGKGTFYVADDADNLFALDETTGAIVWSKAIDTPATTYGSGCGNDPGNGTGPAANIGITGTPVIDLPNRTIYLVAVHAVPVGTTLPIQTYKIHALSIDTGAELTSPAGWPIDVSTITSAGMVKFNPQPQIERSALALVNGFLYIPFGGEDGDCGDYHGWVVSVPTANPAGVTGYTTGTSKAGMWAVGGIASDGTDVFGATSNGAGGTSAWAGNEAVVRFHDGSTFTGATTDFFAPSNWAYLDDHDLDLGGTGPVVIDIPGTTPSSLVLAYGKSGLVHVLDRTNLGGIAAGATGMAVTSGQGIFSAEPTSTQIRNGPVAYATGGTTYTAFQASCTGGDLLALKFATSGVPSYTQAWCANTGSQGSPMVTTTDAMGSNPIVWMSGASLTGWDGATGAQVFANPAIALQNVSKWTTPIDVKGRIFVGAGTQLYALTTQ
jgi:hypothetical protein